MKTAPIVDSNTIATDGPPFTTPGASPGTESKRPTSLLVKATPVTTH